MRKKHILLLGSLIGIIQWGQAQTILKNNNANIRVHNPNTKLRVEQGEIINNGNINNAGAIYLDRNYSQGATGTYSATASSWLWFEGSSNQSIQSSNAIDVIRLKVQNGNKLLLSNNITVSHTVDLSNNSKIELGNFNLNCPNTNIINYNSSSYIVSNGNGALIQQLAAGDIKEYPVGNSGYNPVILLSNTGATDDFSVRVADQILTNGDTGTAETANHVNRTWHINESVSGGNDIDLSVEWSASEELATFDRNNSSIKHWNGSSWDYGAYGIATLSGGRWSQTRSNVSSFSPFAVADNSIFTLPLTWLDFSAKVVAPQEHLLQWTTAAEEGNSHFEVEMMLETEQNFSKIGQLLASTSREQVKTYQFISPNTHIGTTYYRIKQVDNDGKFSYSSIQTCTNNQSQTQAQIYPNPASQSINLQLSASADNPISVQVMDLTGKILIQKEEISGDFLNLDISQLAAGHYQLQIKDQKNNTKTQPFIKL